MGPISRNKRYVTLEWPLRGNAVLRIYVGAAMMHVTTIIVIYLCVCEHVHACKKHVLVLEEDWNAKIGQYA